MRAQRAVPRPLGRPQAGERAREERVSKGKETAGFVPFGLRHGLRETSHHCKDACRLRLWPDPFHPCLVPATPG